MRNHLFYYRCTMYLNVFERKSMKLAMVLVVLSAHNSWFIVVTKSGRKPLATWRAFNGAHSLLVFRDKHHFAASIERWKVSLIHLQTRLTCVIFKVWLQSARKYHKHVIGKLSIIASNLNHKPQSVGFSQLTQHMQCAPLEELLLPNIKCASNHILI